jgi:ribosomal protein L15E
MAKTQYWSLNYRQEKWLREIMMEYPSYLTDLDVFDMINAILKERLYNRIQREKLNELGRKFKIINKKHQEALKKHHISLK